MIYVYTTISDGFDNLRAPQVVSNSENVRYVCFTNIPNLPKVGPWEYRPLPDIGNASKRDRVPKLLPHLMLPSDVEYSIYHDGNFQLKKLPEDLIREYLDSHDWAAHKHPARDCVYAEADLLLNAASMEGWRRQDPSRADRIQREIQAYRSAGYPEHAGLWANGLLIRRHTRQVINTCEQWWKAFQNGSGRDQLSFPVVRRDNNLEVNTINDGIYSSPLMNFWWHAAWKDKDSNQGYRRQRKEIHTNLMHLNTFTGTKFNYPVYD